MSIPGFPQAKKIKDDIHFCQKGEVFEVRVTTQEQADRLRKTIDDELYNLISQKPAPDQEKCDICLVFIPSKT